MMGLNISSITTICGTDCTMKDIDIKSNGNRVTTTYKYTDVAGDKGLADAKKYYNYLSRLPSCVKIDDYGEAKGEFVNSNDPCCFSRASLRKPEGETFRNLWKALLN